MRDKEEFFNILSSIDKKDFTEYTKLIGDFDFSRYVLKINQIQEEGAGKSTMVLVRVPQIIAGFPQHLYNTPLRRTALEDFLTRKVGAVVENLACYNEQGVSYRRISIAAPAQKILPRSSMAITEESVEARVYIDMPIREGLIAGDAAREIFFEEFPALVNSSLIYCNLSEKEVDDFVNLMEDADQVRQVLPTRGWVSFVGEGALLTRQSNTDLPDYDQLLPISAVEDIAVTLEVPNEGAVRGFGVPSGLTVILGDAYSGRVELMRAIAAGVYNHVPGDGREMVITVPDAVYVAAEPGRSVQRVDISAFVNSGAGLQDTKQFSSACADPCAAQAASTVEAIEVGARVLLFDESDSSPEFLAIDSRTAGLLPNVERRVTPLSMRARQIVDELGISIIMAGTTSVAEYIAVADTVLCIDGFKVSNITKEARGAVSASNAVKAPPADIAGLVEKSRSIVPNSIDPSADRYDASIDAANIRSLLFGRATIDLSGVKQIADIFQTRSIGRILYYAKLRYMDEPRPIREVLDLIDRDLSTEGLESLTRDLRGDLARPRRYEIAAALNRLGTLRILRPPTA